MKGDLMKKMLTLLLLVLIVSGCSQTGRRHFSSAMSQWWEDTLVFFGISDPDFSVMGSSGSGVAVPGGAALHQEFMSVPYIGLKQHTTTRVGNDIYPSVAVTSDGKEYLVFSSNRHNQCYDIYMRELGKKSLVQRLTNESGNDIMPAISPDGRVIAFASNRSGNYDIWVRDVGANTGYRQVTDTEDIELHPSWHYSGRKIVYSAYSTYSCQWEMRIYDFNTQETTLLGEGLFPSWSHSGEQIVYQLPRKRGTPWYAIWVINSDGTNNRLVVESSDWAAINPKWSPDDRYITFATVSKSKISRMEDRWDNGDDIFIVKANGSNLTQLTHDISAEYWPTWGKDRIYFVSNRGEASFNVFSLRPVLSADFGKIAQVDQFDQETGN